MVRLRDRAHVKDYVWFLEELLIRTAAEFGVTAVRVDGRAGIWVLADRDDDGAARPDRKVGAIGIRVSHDVTMHGFALNVLSSAERFGNIIPCGIADAGVTSIVEELGGDWTVTGVADDLRDPLTRALTPLLD